MHFAHSVTTWTTSRWGIYDILSSTNLHNNSELRSAEWMQRFYCSGHAVVSMCDLYRLQSVCLLSNVYQSKSSHGFQRSDYDQLRDLMLTSDALITGRNILRSASANSGERSTDTAGFIVRAKVNRSQWKDHVRRTWWKTDVFCSLVFSSFFRKNRQKRSVMTRGECGMWKSALSRIRWLNINRFVWRSQSHFAIFQTLSQIKRLAAFLWGIRIRLQVLNF